MLRVFTTADAVEAFNAEQGVDTPLERWNGKDLFEQLTIYAHDGALFNDIGGLPGHALSLDAVDAVWRGGQLPAPGQSAPAPDPQVAAPAPQPAEPATPVMVQAGQPCTRCGAPAAGDTDWCLNCGLAMRAPQQPLPLPGAEELGPIFPIIQRHDWPGRGPTIHRSVCWLPRIPGTPWVSIGWETGGMTAYVGQESLAKVGQTAEQVEQHAVANLGRAPGSWEKVMAPSARPDECVLACKDSRSAERILEQDFMRHAQRMFGCDMLAVTMAARNGLVVGPAAMAETLMMMAEHVFGQSGEAAITPWCFAVADGMVRGRFFLENGQLGLDAAF